MLPPSSLGLKQSRDGRGKQRRQTGRTKTDLRKIQGRVKRLGTWDGRCFADFSGAYGQIVSFSRDSPVRSCCGVFLGSSGMNSFLRHLAQKVLRLAFATCH